MLDSMAVATLLASLLVLLALTDSMNAIYEWHFELTHLTQHQGTDSAAQSLQVSGLRLSGPVQESGLVPIFVTRWLCLTSQLDGGRPPQTPARCSQAQWPVKIKKS